MRSNLPSELPQTADALQLAQRPMRVYPKWVAEGEVDGVRLWLRASPSRAGLRVSLRAVGPEGRLHEQTSSLAGLEGRCEAWVREGVAAARAAT